MSDPKNMEPDIIGTGAARGAARKISGRQKQIDDAVDAAQGIPPAPPPPKSEEPEKMSTHLMRRIAEMIRGKKQE